MKGKTMLAVPEFSDSDSHGWNDDPFGTGGDKPRRYRFGWKRIRRGGVCPRPKDLEYRINRSTQEKVKNNRHGNKIAYENKLQNQYPNRFLRQGRIWLILMIAAFIFSPLTPAAAAEEKPDEKGGWEFQVAPYLWAISMNGDATVKGQKADVDVSFSDIWDELNFAFMLEYEARKGRWGLWGNTIYANLGKSNAEVSGIEIEPTINAIWQGAGGLYRLGTWDLADASDKNIPSVTVDTYFGARYTYLDLSLDIKGADNVDGDKHWVEPLVGVRTRWDLSERWTINLTGDIGGIAFGSDFAWDALGLLGYRFSLFGEDNASAFAGYRALSQDYSDGSGDDKFEWDVTLYGPVLGLLVTF
jgi:hypothetical protein